MQIRHNDLQMSRGLTLLKIIIKNTATLPLGGRREAETESLGYAASFPPSPRLPEALLTPGPLHIHSIAPGAMGTSITREEEAVRRFTENNKTREGIPKDA